MKYTRKRYEFEILGRVDGMTTMEERCFLIFADVNVVTSKRFRLAGTFNVINGFRIE
jgi:hypothetical protein